MKKLMFAVATAAMVGGAFADACSEVSSGCKVWDVNMSLKTLKAAKQVSCVDASDPCDEQVSKVYYMDNVTRKIKGILWACEYVCEGGLNVALWDPTNKKAIWMADYSGPINVDNVVVYGKKATKVAGSVSFDNDNISVEAAGVNGKFVRGGNDDNCYIKSLSGYAAGKLAWIAPTAKSATISKGNLCEDPVICEEELPNAKLLGWCDACCFENWCDADDAEELVPAVGTWSMKYNKGAAKKSLAQLVPSYAY